MGLVPENRSSSASGSTTRTERRTSSLVVTREALTGPTSRDPEGPSCPTAAGGGITHQDPKTNHSQARSVSEGMAGRRESDQACTRCFTISATRPVWAPPSI